MAPILIDSRDLIKLGFISVLTAMVVFSAGFISGHQQAVSFYLTDNILEPLSLPEKVSGLESDIAPQLPEIIDAGEEMDVDQPELASTTIVHLVSMNKTGSEISHVDTADSFLAIDNRVNDKLLVANQSINIVTESVQTVNSEIAVDDRKSGITSNEYDDNISANADNAAIENFQAVALNSLSPDELNKIKYSIQVGMYGRLINAETMMTALQAQQLNAYVSDHVNKKNEVRYNVRFGYFTDKKAALSSLEKYKNKQNGDGYLVKFSVENITNLAHVENINKPVNIESNSENVTPEKESSDVIQDESSPLDTVNSTNILLHAPSEILAKSEIEGLEN